MSFIAPNFRHPEQGANGLGLRRSDYEGALSTLCAGCGHDSVSAAIVQACFEMDVEPHRVGKFSGIGCSSKTPNYFLNHSHGFNSVHGRMPSVATGAILGNRDLLYIGISGDGDTASIGMGQFIHAARRNLDMLYLVENNGCYGLTKGQDSATADLGSVSKTGVATELYGLDLCALALQSGASLVGRSFSGDKSQLVQLLKTAIAHRGFAFLDVISPCVTFNNTPASTKSYDYAREHIDVAGALDFVPHQSAIEIDYAEGEVQKVHLHDGSELLLEKVGKDAGALDDKTAALAAMNRAQDAGRMLTGLLYLDTELPDLHTVNRTVATPLNQLGQDELFPGLDALEQINAEQS
ncbi:MAG: 2-oxoacid:ferredoxin oxidoreductase subunit beta [Gammaproteobacteria bacterium AqS3]|nr:2-oxoacid:ferredoxin oxidoreductase subunit beta [Gammaproteobacteria bacterium AqS3]